jgi:hypothetical protein
MTKVSMAFTDLAEKGPNIDLLRERVQSLALLRDGRFVDAFSLSIRA